mmetsp:Transcript_11362/g.47332  ORF Transcript_11362/g.47332 Transcript_11362/m.47332 type:complete len:577 (-) Transcript_11362:167-1897(-)
MIGFVGQAPAGHSGHGKRVVSGRCRSIRKVSMEPVEKIGVSEVSGLNSIPEEIWERALGGSKFEKIKAAKDGSEMWKEIYTYAEKVRNGEITYEDIDSDDLNIRYKWAGLFHRPKATPGRFMSRLKVPNGILNSEQLRFFGEFIARYGDHGCGDITTRMNIQLRGIVVEDAGDLVDGLNAVGLTNIQSGMDNVRNLVGSPIAGIDPHEMFDTRQICKDIDNFITGDRKGNKEITNLPRKFNICVSGSRDDFAHTHINDIGLKPMKNEDGVMGFNVDIGGYFSSKRAAHSIPMDVWVHPDDVVAFCKAMLLVFRDNGERKDRQKSRMMWLVEAWGLEKFRSAVEKRMGKTLAREAKPGPEFDTPFPRRDVLGVHPQKQEGYSWVGCRVPVGRLFAKDFFEMADVADKYSDGEMRLTVEQGIIFPNVKNEELDTMLAEPLLQRFSPSAGNVTRGLVACTGSQFCPQGIVDTKGRAVRIAQLLEEELDIPELVRMHWTGCPNSCAQVQVADIGLMGAKARIPGVKGPVDGVDIYLGGKIGENTELGTLYKKGVPAEPEFLIPALKEIMIERFNCTEKKS